MPSQGEEGRRARHLNVSLQAMEVFCEVLRLESFSLAGDAVGISQSAVSQLVAHLEAELGVQLVDRKRRPLRPTPEGNAYCQGCQEILHRHRRLFDEICSKNTGRAATVRVASIYSVGLHTLSGYIRRFMSQSPGAVVRLEYYHPVKVYSAVLNDEADLGVISYPQGTRELKVQTWLEEEMALACPPGHRLARAKSLRLEALEGEQFVAFEKDLKIRKEIDRELKAHHVSLKIVSEFDNIETIKQALEISQAVSILPRPSMQREIERGTLVEIPIKDTTLKRPVGIVTKRKRRLTPTCERFLQTLLEKAPQASGLPPASAS